MSDEQVTHEHGDEYVMRCFSCTPVLEMGPFDTLRAAEIAMRAHEKVHHPERTHGPVFRVNPDGSREQVW